MATINNPANKLADNNNCIVILFKHFKHTVDLWLFDNMVCETIACRPRFQRVQGNKMSPRCCLLGWTHLSPGSHALTRDYTNVTRLSRLITFQMLRSLATTIYGSLLLQIASI